MAIVDCWMARRKLLGLSPRTAFFSTLDGKPLKPSYVRTLSPRLAAKFLSIGRSLADWRPVDAGSLEGSTLNLKKQREVGIEEGRHMSNSFAAAHLGNHGSDRYRRWT